MLTGVLGGAFWIRLPRSLNMARTLPERWTNDDVVAHFEGALLNEHGGDCAGVLLQLGFDDDAGGGSIGISFDILHFGDQQDHFQQVVDACTLAGRDGDADDIAAVFFDYQANIR